MKFSKQRELILKEIFSSDTHPTADMIYSNLKKYNPMLSLGTVYRNLSKLVNTGMICKLSIPNQPDRFDRNTKLHSHLLCEYCSQIYDIEPKSIGEFIDNLSADQNLCIKTYTLVLYGSCKNCNPNKI